MVSLENKNNNQVAINNDVIVSGNEVNPESIYLKTKMLGSGAFGEVWLVHHRDLDRDFAMKIIKKRKNKKNDEREILNEIEILKKLDHPKILKVVDFYSTLKKYYIITEYCHEGELFNEIIKVGKFDEGQAAFIINQILKAITYCHKMNIIHRDIKPENIMITNREKNGCLQVKNHKTRLIPGKNEVNFAYAASTTETLLRPDPKKFYGTEYVIYTLEQICPLISVKFKRDEFCFIWHDPNFSKDPIYGKIADEKFKNYLKERIRYINQMAKFNVYTFINKEDALKCVNRKKYNRIILISNVGQDLGGRAFVDEARQIIGSNSIVLFSAYDREHLKWITKYKNALFSNNSKLTEEFLESFSDTSKINGLIEKFNNAYSKEKVRFNFDNNYLYFPHFKPEGNYSDLSF